MRARAPKRRQSPLDGSLNDTVFMGDNPDPAIDAFQRVLDDALIPFLKEWWRLPGVVSGEKELAGFRKRLPDRVWPNGYEWMPEFLRRIASGIRFSRRSYVNIHPSPHLPSVIAALAVSLQNPNHVVRAVSEATTSMEEEAVAWIAEHLAGYDPAKAWGHIISGGTLGNTTALLVARDYCLDKLSRPCPREVARRGIAGSAQGVVLTSTSGHYSLKKALWILGLGHENLIMVPVAWDEGFKRTIPKDERFISGIHNEKWRPLIIDARKTDAARGAEELASFYRGDQQPFSLQPLDSAIYQALYSCFQFGVPVIAYVATCGTTDTGTIESINTPALEFLREKDIHIHVDGATGGFALAHPDIRRRADGVHHADSFVVDGHKLGLLPYPNGAIIFKDRNSRHQIEHDAPYLGVCAPTIEGSRSGGPSAALWAATRSIGLDGYRRHVDRVLKFTRRVVRNLEASGEFQVLHRVDLNFIAFAPKQRRGECRHELNTVCRELEAAIREDGSYLVNFDRTLAGVRVQNTPGVPGTEDDITDISAVRMVVTHPLVEMSDADTLVERLLKKLPAARRRARNSPVRGKA